MKKKIVETENLELLLLKHIYAADLGKEFSIKLYKNPHLTNDVKIEIKVFYKNQYESKFFRDGTVPCDCVRYFPCIVKSVERFNTYDISQQYYIVHFKKINIENSKLVLIGHNVWMGNNLIKNYDAIKEGLN